VEAASLGDGKSDGPRREREQRRTEVRNEGEPDYTRRRRDRDVIHIRANLAFVRGGDISAVRSTEETALIVRDSVWVVTCHTAPSHGLFQEKLRNQFIAA
jgi:hypothetical protein